MATNDNNIENKIIETAQQLFVKNGFTDTNMSDIAAAVGINRPTLHYYFRTKDKMFQAVFWKHHTFFGSRNSRDYGAGQTHIRTDRQGSRCLFQNIYR